MENRGKRTTKEEQEVSTTAPLRITRDAAPSSGIRSDGAEVLTAPADVFVPQNHPERKKRAGAKKRKKSRPAPLRGCDFFCAIEGVCGYKECISYPGAGEADGAVGVRQPERRQTVWVANCKDEV